LICFIKAVSPGSQLFMLYLRGALNHKHLVSATTRHFERDIDACFCAGLPVNENENPNQRPKTVSVSQGSKNKGTPGRKVGFSMWMWMRMWSWSWWARGDGASMCNFLPITFCTHTCHTQKPSPSLALSLCSWPWRTGKCSHQRNQHSGPDTRRP